MRSPEILIEKFRKSGLRVTPQRRIILETLSEDETHPSVDEIYQRLRIKMPEMSRSTVYNTLHELVDLGEVHEVEVLGNGSTRYDTKTEDHHHLYCEHCHKLIDVNLNLVAIDLAVENSLGYKIQRSQVTFYGICPDCQLNHD